MTNQAAKDLARLVYDRTRARNGSCAVFVNNFGLLFLTRGYGSQYASNLFRYPDGLIGVYDRRARLGDILADVQAVDVGAAVAA